MKPVSPENNITHKSEKIQRKDRIKLKALKVAKQQQQIQQEQQAKAQVIKEKTKTQSQEQKQVTAITTETIKANVKVNVKANVKVLDEGQQVLKELLDIGAIVEYTECGQTPIKKRKYKGKIEAKTEPGFQRAIRDEGGVGKSVLMVNAYWELNNLEVDTDEKDAIMLNLLADQDGSLLTERETMYWIENSTPYKLGKAFSAEKVLDKMLRAGIIKDYSGYNHRKGLARESLILPIKGLSLIIEKIVKFYLDTSLEDLLRDFDPIRKRDKVFYSNRDEEFEVMMGGVDELIAKPEKARTYCGTIPIIGRLKSRQIEEGITIELLEDLVSSVCPGVQPERKKRVLTNLVNHYKLVDLLTEEIETEKSGDELYNCLVWSRQ